MVNSPDPSADRRMRPYLFLIIALGMCLRLVYFSEDIGGSHTFRQAMVANQIDTLKSKPYPGPKLGFLERYDQTYDYAVVFYDTPIYQYVAAKISDFFNIAGVKAGRIVNLVVYVGMSLLSYEILMGIGLGLTASLLTVVLFALSPLAIQTTFGIYPDTLAVLAAYLSFYLLLRYERQGSWHHLAMALVFGVVCTLIKSSIYVVFMVAYGWKLLWTSGWRVLRRIDVMLFGLVIAASVAAFVLERQYFNWGLGASNYDESLRLSWFFGTKSRLNFSEWSSVGQRITTEYMFPLFMLLALVGLWRVIKLFTKKPAEPQLTLLGLVIGSFVTLLIFFNVIVVHDYYALPFLPIYCALVSIGMLYAYSFVRMPYSRYPLAYKALAVAAIFGSVWYAYSLRLMNYNGNKIMIETGKSVQELVPANGYLFYFHGADYINPEYLYYARRRGVLAHIDRADNDFVNKTIKDHRWDPGETYLLANAVRPSPLQQERLKARLDSYDLKEIGTSLDHGIIYKLSPKS
jgi:MFS family permease